MSLNLTRIPVNKLNIYCNILVQNILNFLDTGKSLYSINNLEFKEEFLLSKQIGVSTDVYSMKNNGELAIASLGRYKFIYLLSDMGMKDTLSSFTPYINNDDKLDWRYSFIFDCNILKDENLINFISKIIAIEFAKNIYDQCGEYIIYQDSLHIKPNIDNININLFDQVYVFANIYYNYFEILHEVLSFSEISNPYYKKIEKIYNEVKDSPIPIEDMVMKIYKSK